MIIRTASTAESTPEVQISTWIGLYTVCMVFQNPNTASQVSHISHQTHTFSLNSRISAR